MTKPVPAPSQKLLQPYPDLKLFNKHFHYLSIIGKLNHLAMLMHPGIQFVLHLCARFSTCPKQEHGDAIKYLSRYLKGTSEIAMLFHPKKNEVFKVYADADFAGNWLKE